MTTEPSLLIQPASTDPDTELKIRIELGRAALSSAALAGVKQGDVIPLATEADSPVELFVEDQLIGRGVMVIVDAKIGVQITELFGIER